MATSNLLYIDLAEFEAGKVIRGGALVVDPTTEPLEFRCTNGVRPTKLQSIIWGRRLEGYIATDLLAKPLMKSLKQPFSLVVVKEQNFLDLRGDLQVPLVCLNRDAKILFQDPSPEEPDRQGAEEELADEEESPEAASDEESGSPFLVNPSGHFEPIILTCHDRHQDDLKSVRQALHPIFLRRDVMEPFERIARALQFVHEQNPKE